MWKLEKSSYVCRRSKSMRNSQKLGFKSESLAAAAVSIAAAAGCNKYSPLLLQLQSIFLWDYMHQYCLEEIARLGLLFVRKFFKLNLNLHFEQFGGVLRAKF